MNIRVGMCFPALVGVVMFGVVVCWHRGCVSIVLNSLTSALIFNGLVTGSCTEIFLNTNPNHYKVKIVYEDRSVDTFEEEEIVRVDSGIEKPAKKITALDTLNGKKIWIVEKEEIDGDTAVCNLASVNLSKINREEDIKRVVPTAIRMLDYVIDLNFYPLDKVNIPIVAVRL